MSQTQYRCGECGASFSSQQDLEEHNRTVHSRFTCDTCGESFGSKSELEAHNRVAHPEVQKSGRS